MDDIPNEDEPQESLQIFNDDEIKNILRDALALKLKDRKKRPRKVELNNALIITMGEFLSCFKLIGYDLDGNPVNMTVYKENMEKSALDNAFMEEVGKFMNTRVV